MLTFWTIWVRATTETKARRLYARVLERMQCPSTLDTIEPYPKINGFVLRYHIILESQSWNDALVETLALGQRFAHGWCISGNVHQDPSASSDRTNIAGVVLAEWRLIAADDQAQNQPEQSAS